jgi:anti-sigma regulatory factor (Ser/Thr protein kinase)
MRSLVRLKLAGAIRSGLDEFANRWVKFIRANDLVPDFGESAEESENQARVGLEVLANLLEDADYSSYEYVIQRLLHEWINNAGAYSDLLKIEESFSTFFMPLLDIDPESEESDEVLYALDEFFHSDIRARFLSDYLLVYEEIIGKESYHTAYVLAHFDAILNLTALLNSATSLDDILDNLAPALKSLFENVIGIAIWTENENGLSVRSIEILDEEITPLAMESDLPEVIDEVYNVGEVRWIPDKNIPPNLLSLIDIETLSGKSACAIPIRPSETFGLLAFVIIGSDQPGTMELSLSRVASAECALALDRVNERDRINSVNQSIGDILALSRETAWGSGCRDTADTILDYLIDLTGGTKAILLAAPAHSAKAIPVNPLAWRDIPEEDVKTYGRMSKLPAIVSIALKSKKPILLLPDKLKSVLGGKKLPAGFAPSEREALGVLPLERHGEMLGVCIFQCRWQFAIQIESRDLLAIFSRSAADAIATAREYERSLKIAVLVKEDLERARILQQKITPRYKRSGNLVFWANLVASGDFAGDILVARNPSDGIINIWMADIAGRGAATGWSVLFVRQLLAELPHNTENPGIALEEINRKLTEIESETSSGILVSLIGIHIDANRGIGRFARAGAPKLLKVGIDGEIDSFDPDGFPLGLFPEAGLQELEFKLEPGDKLVWASPGLQGARSESGKTWGETGLLDSIKNAYFLPPKALYDAILADVGDFAENDDVIEDRSLLVIGLDSPPDFELTMPGSERHELQASALSWLESKGIKSWDFHACKLLLDEAVRNAYEHGNGSDDNSVIELRLNQSPKHIHFRIRDEGGKLNNKVTSTNLRPENILEDKGRGFLLMRHQSDHLWVDEDSGELNAVRILEETE